MNIIDKLKIGFCALFGGVTGLIKALLDWFNDRVLSRIKDKETAAKCLADIRDFRVFLGAVFARHIEWMSEARRVAADKILAAIDTLCAALEDFKLEPEELDAIIDAVKEAIDAWKKAK